MIIECQKRKPFTHSKIANAPPLPASVSLETVLLARGLCPPSPLQSRGPKPSLQNRGLHTQKPAELDDSEIDPRKM